MKQLELNVTIGKIDNNEWGITVTPQNVDNSMLISYYRGTTRQEVVENLCKSLVDKNLRYWFLLDE